MQYRFSPVFPIAGYMNSSARSRQTDSCRPAAERVLQRTAQAWMLRPPALPSTPDRVWAGVTPPCQTVHPPPASSVPPMLC